MSSPQRHGPAQYFDAQKLQLPQEIVDMIEANIQGLSRRLDIIKLRLTCHTFAEGLFNTLVTTCIKDYVLYTDEQGIEDITWLANSRLAPSVQSIRLADRKISFHMLEYQAVDDVKRQENINKVQEKLALAGDWSDIYGKLHVFREPSTKNKTGDVVQFLSYLGMRVARQREACDELHSGWEVKWTPMDCSSMRTLDLRPRPPSLHRLALALSKFPNIKSMSTSLAKQVIVQSRAIYGQVVKSSTLHGISGRMPDVGLIKCVCVPRKPAYLRCRHVENDVLWPAATDIGLLMPMLPLDLPFFTTLTTLDLSFYGRTAIDAAREDPKNHASSIAVFISQCTSLEKLYLRTSTGRDTTIHAKIGGIGRVVRSLPPLRSLHYLHIDHLDATTLRCLEFLAVHAVRLESLILPSCLPSSALDDVNYVKQWGALLIAMSGSESLVDVLFGFIRDPILSRVEAHVLYLVEHLTGAGGVSRKRMARFARAFEYWDGSIESFHAIRFIDPDD